MKKIISEIMKFLKIAQNFNDCFNCSSNVDYCNWSNGTCSTTDTKIIFPKWCNNYDQSLNDSNSTIIMKNYYRKNEKIQQIFQSEKFIL